MTEDTFHIRTYGKGELAQLYCPDITTTAARRKLMRWINHYPNLMDELQRAGFSEGNRTFTPMQVRLIVSAIGEP